MARKVERLPVMAATPTDIIRLIQELVAIDESLLQLGIRKGGTAVKLPKTSQLMDMTVKANLLNLLHDDDRRMLRRFLEEVRKKSPVLHMSFSADPSPAFIEKLMTWLRKEIHPQVLLSIGLQPTLGAGCIVRTTNKQFDFSLRQDFLNKRELLLKQIAKPETALAEPTAVKQAPPKVGESA